MIITVMWSLWSANLKMGQIFHMDIWPMLTSAQVNIRVTCEQKENLLIPWYITWNNSIQHSYIHSNNHVKYASWNKWVLIQDLKCPWAGIVWRLVVYRSTALVQLQQKTICQSSQIDIAEMLVDGFPWIAKCALCSTEWAVSVGMQVRVHSGPCKQSGRSPKNSSTFFCY